MRREKTSLYGKTTGVVLVDDPRVCVVDEPSLDRPLVLRVAPSIRTVVVVPIVVDAAPDALAVCRVEPRSVRGTIPRRRSAVPGCT